MTEKNMLLKRVQECDFILHDTALFLDVNPTNQEALAYYKMYQAKRREAVDRYVKKYGALKRGDYDGGGKWNWVYDPWPWEAEKEV